MFCTLLNLMTENEFSANEFWDKEHVAQIYPTHELYIVTKKSVIWFWTG